MSNTPLPVLLFFLMLILGIIGGQNHRFRARLRAVEEKLGITPEKLTPRGLLKKLPLMAILLLLGLLAGLILVYWIIPIPAQP